MGARSPVTATVRVVDGARRSSCVVHRRDMSHSAVLRRGTNDRAGRARAEGPRREPLRRGPSTSGRVPHAAKATATKRHAMSVARRGTDGCNCLIKTFIKGWYRARTAELAALTRATCNRYLSVTQRSNQTSSPSRVRDVVSSNGVDEFPSKRMGQAASDASKTAPFARTNVASISGSFRNRGCN